MKQELPIAVCLLALGGWLCSNLGQRETAPQHQWEQFSSEHKNFSAAEQLAAPHADGLHSTTIDQVAYWENVNAPPQPLTADISAIDEPTDPPQTTPLFGRMYPAQSWLAVSANSQSKQCKQQLRSIGAALSQTPSLATRTSIDCRLHGINLTASGKYFRDGLHDRSRMELTFGDPTLPHSLLQISDPDYVYTLRSDSKKPKLEFIDLARLENKDAILAASAMPTGWVVGGGLGKSLAHYAGAFDLRLEPFDDSSKIVMRGIWDPATLINLLHSGTPQAERPTKIVWADVPTQVPHTIEFIFSKHPSGLIQPHRFAFFKFDIVSGQSVAKEVLQIRFDPLLLDRNLPDGLFTIEANGFEAADMTEPYNRKIRQLAAGQPKIANDPAPSNFQIR